MTKEKVESTEKREEVESTEKREEVPSFWKFILRFDPAISEDLYKRMTGEEKNPIKMGMVYNLKPTSSNFSFFSGRGGQVHRVSEDGKVLQELVPPFEKPMMRRLENVVDAMRGRLAGEKSDPFGTAKLELSHLTSYYRKKLGDGLTSVATFLLKDAVKKENERVEAFKRRRKRKTGISY